MKKLLGIFCLLMLWSNTSNSFEVGQNVYLNACGSSPTEYFNSPLKIHNILFEAPNKITKLEESKYEREFQTLATSTINILDKQITFNLSNFRDMTIKDNRGIVYEDRRVSGATSIYEIKHKGEVVAWGVGWHKRCKEFYAQTDFTAFRLYVPYLDNGEIKIQNKLTQLKINQVKEALIEGGSLVLADGIDISGNSNSSTYNYHGASFFEIDNKNGINFDLSFEELNKKIDINKLNPALILSTLIKYKQLEKLNDYTKNNFDKIYEDFGANYWWDVWDGNFYIKIDDRKDSFEKWQETLKKLSITYEKIDKLYEASYHVVPKEELEAVKKNCFSNDSYEDIIEFIGSCYPWHSSWMFNSITTVDDTGLFEKYSKNPKLDESIQTSKKVEQPNKKLEQLKKKVEQTSEDGRTVTENRIDVAWKVGDKFIIPECFDYVRDYPIHYIIFFDRYIEEIEFHRLDPRFKNFISEIGTYLNKEVPLNHWVKRISLSKQLDSCMSDKPETEVMFIDEDGNHTEIRYEVVETYNVEKGKELAPHIKQEFESIKKVDVAARGGGLVPSSHQVIYGLLTIEGKKVLLPLKNYVNHFRIFN